MNENALRSPIRVLHTLASMNAGGVEKWLLEVARRIDRERFQLDFLVHSAGPHHFEAELRELGCRLIHCPNPSNPIRYAMNLRKILKQGRYDIIHSHLLFFSGYIAWLARLHGIRARIVHCHNTCPARTSASFKGMIRRLLHHGVLYHWIDRFATQKIGASHDAGRYLFGANWESDQHSHLIHCGIDLAPFSSPTANMNNRREPGIPSGAFVAGHVGKMKEQKNHQLILNIALELKRRHIESIHFVLIGDGPLRPEIEQFIQDNDLSSAVHLLGVRNDVPNLMKSCFDLFLLPSLFEGLGLVCIEAQAAGLPCLISDTVPKEADVVEGMVQRLSLDDGAERWADALIRMSEQKQKYDIERVHQRIREEAFDIDSSVNVLQSLYEESLAGEETHASR